MATTATLQQPIQGRRRPVDDVREIAIDAYMYAYPLVLMEVTRREVTNVEEPTKTGRAPMNQFAHMPTCPDATFTDISHPNADALYSILWYDVAKEPLVISVADSGGRYYLLEMIDMWSDVFASPGARTTGTAAQVLMLVAPGWTGTTPADVTLIRSPTATGWIIGRTQTNGPADYAEVHAFQRGLTAVPLGLVGTADTPRRGVVDSALGSKRSPVAQVENMSTSAFFSLFAQVARNNPPHANDYPMLHRLKRLGIDVGKAFSFDDLASEVRDALEQAAPTAHKRIVEMAQRSGVAGNGWRTNLTGVGTYGTDYIRRAAVAYFGLGANTVDDAVYPTAFTDATGKVMSGDHRYVLHFANGQLPPVRAFWSLTMYDERQLFTINALNRYAIGSRDALQLNADGSLDLFVQRDSPGPDHESNWLPAPASGPFTMNLRLYWPQAAVIAGTWSPPPVQRVT